MLIAVTNRRLCAGSFEERVSQLICAGTDKIILREKDLPEDKYRFLLENLMPLFAHNPDVLVAHSHVDAAMQTGVRHVHLPYRLFEKYRHVLSTFQSVGVSVHSPREAAAAAEQGANFLIAGHIYPTDCKKGFPPRGTPYLKTICQTVDIPVFAIGGITPGKLAAIKSTGAKGVCVMKRFMVTEDVHSDVSEYKRQWDACTAQSPFPQK